MTPGRGQLPTASLRRRITFAVLGVLTCALVASAIAVASLFTAQSRADARQQLADREVMAAQMDRRDVPLAQIARRVSGRGVLAKITAPDGHVVGPAALLDPSPNQRTRTKPLPSGAVLTLLSSTSEQDAATARLHRLLLVVVTATVAVTALALLLTVRVALRPLDAMTTLARSITRGSRGRRLNPDRPGTEIGQVAAAFDEALGALEEAERDARESAARTRRFVADAAHELRTPTAGVRAAAEALLHAEADPETRERMTALLIGEARRTGRLVEDLLSLARIDAGLELVCEPVDLDELARREAERMELLAPSLRWHVEGEPTVVRADADRIGQVLTNLLDNARKHTPDGGSVRVRVTGGERFAEVTVADDGPGVPPGEQERVFDRWVRLDESRSGGGAGLGLPVARGIARAHGGELSCVDHPGDGAVFRLTLPG
ncbi:HAMP domain-containing histidine kinase [Saccharopolyspora erythraea]|uniref:HAMP domain-containing sensor histidine kinase n=1 Tax=Saccharopolyspora erythraea TaxID=1836 RepID=UPI001BAABEBA|nr:HAMP domain-containing sensor histidine kinase [Saccharopolyspora erythraea]QUH03869.1 HAMP domain-containing histidine kinase [Saccharopolyspora erythraea]